jgi:hypothetical protein
VKTKIPKTIWVPYQHYNYLILRLNQGLQVQIQHSLVQPWPVAG